MEKYIIIGKNKKIKHVDDVVFETDIYDNSGILDPSIMGFIRYEIFDDHIQLIQIFIDPEERRGGYGFKLVKSLERITRKEGKKKIVTYTGMNKGDVFGDFLISMEFRITKPGRWEKQL